MIAGMIASKASQKAMTCVVKESTNVIKNLISGWNYYRQMEVVVGIPEETNSDRGSINNAELLYLHDQGVPSKNIPPRPVLKPAIAEKETQEKIKSLMHDAAVAALVKGNKTECENDFHKAGMIGRDACKNWIVSGSHLAPNAPSTVAAKGSSKPLIDTASMLNSISYAVRKK